MPAPRPTDSERRWAAGAHLASLPGMALGLGFLGPLLVLWLRSWGSRGSQGSQDSQGSRMVRHHAVAAVNFNLTVGLVGLLGLIGSAALARGSDDGGPDWGAGAAVSLIVLLTVYWFLFTVRAALSARYGERCRYPLSLPILRR